MRATLRAIYDRWLEELEAFVDGLGRQGWIAADRSSRELAVQLLSMVEGGLTHGAIFGGLDEQALVRGCLKLLRGDPSSGG